MLIRPTFLLLLLCGEVLGQPFGAAVLVDKRPNGNFGLSIAGDNGEVFVGAPADPSSTSDPGTIYVYDVTGTPPQMSGMINELGAAPGDCFGRNLDLSAIGLLSGAYCKSLGTARQAGRGYLIDPEARTIQQVFQDVPPQSGTRIAFSVVAAGGNILVGASREPAGGIAQAGTAYLFDRTGMLLGVFQDPANVNPNDRFARQVRYAGNSQVLIAAPYKPVGAANMAGIVYLFSIPGPGFFNVCVPAVTFQRQMPRTNDFFGEALVALSDTVVIGAGGQPAEQAPTAIPGIVEVYDRQTGKLRAALNSPDSRNGDTFGVAMAAVGSNVLVGAPSVGDPARPGMAYLFDPAANVVVQKFTSPAGVQQFGVAVASCGDNIAIAGNGVVYLYRPT